VIEERLTGAIHTAEVAVIGGLDRFKVPKQKLLLFLLFQSLSLQSLCSLYTKPLRINNRQIGKMRTYLSH